MKTSFFIVLCVFEFSSFCYSQIHTIKIVNLHYLQLRFWYYLTSKIKKAHDYSRAFHFLFWMQLLEIYQISVTPRKAKTLL